MHQPAFVLLGLPGDQPPCPEQQPELKNIIQNHTCFSGGHRHYELLHPYLPENHEWIPVQSPLEDTINKYRSRESIVVFVSGDPYFFGFGKTLKHYFPEATIRSIPAPNCLQMLARKLQTDYGNIVPLSLHGRNRHRLHTLLLRGEKQLGILTDTHSSPDKLARHLITYGYEHYHFYVGERLGSTTENIRSLTAKEAAQSTFDPLNCIIISSTKAKPARIGQPEDAFHKLPGKSGMITKTPVRLFTLSAMTLNQAGTFWDIGSCTGSMAIEARCMYPALEVTAFEKKEKAYTVLEQNFQKFGTPGIRLIQDSFLADFPEDLSQYTTERIFIGGHGGELENILQKCNLYLCGGGLIGFNAIRHDSLMRFKQWVETHPDYSVLTEETLQQQHENAITIIIAQKNEHGSQ